LSELIEINQCQAGAEITPLRPLRSPAGRVVRAAKDPPESSARTNERRIAKEETSSLADRREECHLVLAALGCRCAMSSVMDWSEQEGDEGGLLEKRKRKREAVCQSGRGREGRVKRKERKEKREKDKEAKACTGGSTWPEGPPAHNWPFLLLWLPHLLLLLVTGKSNLLGLFAPKLVLILAHRIGSSSLSLGA